MGYYTRAAPEFFCRSSGFLDQKQKDRHKGGLYLILKS